MEIYPKWIVEQDSLIIRKATFHKEIAKNIDDVKGGGWFHYIRDLDAFLLYGSSHDFGRVSKETLLDCISKNNVGRSIGCDHYSDKQIFYSLYDRLEDALSNYEHLTNTDKNP